MKRVGIIGAGAAGYFTAIQLLELGFQGEIKLYEKSKPLAKVKVSGGGRCNVTHACFDPKELTQYYPRGRKELLGPFHHFQPGDMIGWLAEKGVELKVEDDGRMFPTTDSSQTIIDCFESQLPQHTLVFNGVKRMVQANGKWELHLDNGEVHIHDSLVVTAGSSPQFADMLSHLGVAMVSAVPSLFTFHIEDEELRALSGLAIEAEVSIKDAEWTTDGPLLLTHWGVSGPAVLKMSAWAARWLAERKYHAEVMINSMPRYHRESLIELLQGIRLNAARKQVRNVGPSSIPNRWWQFVIRDNPANDKMWADVRNAELEEMTQTLLQMTLPISGKSTFKEEFVTAGGVDLKQVNFKTMESKTHPQMFFAGEVLNIDALTGGFNFQAAWTTAFLAANGIVESESNIIAP
ncbi:MAG: aminoacetone oxidase family FAD-binding enzyme [Bacteroidetes bacterium]|nr:aminoacetone oxidase family FAD-binding enzyme [Bacteroidota bacterium]